MNKEVSIPKIKNNTVQVLYDGSFIDTANPDELTMLRRQIVEEDIINNTKEYLKWSFIGHKETPDGPGKRLVVTMDTRGNLSDMPYELSYSRRELYKLVQMFKTN